MEDVVIIGTGCAGWTAAIYTARANLDPLVMAGGQPGGQLTTTSEVENFPGFPEGVDGSTLMFNMQQQAQRFGARIEFKSVERVEVRDEGSFRLFCGEGVEVEARAVIVATGASARMLGLPGEGEIYGKNGLTTCATCDGAFYKGMPVCVVGGGDSACEEATFLTRFASKVHLVHRRNELRATKLLQERAFVQEKIVFAWDTVPLRILGETGVEEIELKNVKSGDLSRLRVDGIFVFIGYCFYISRQPQLFYYYFLYVFHFFTNPLNMKF